MTRLLAFSLILIVGSSGCDFGDPDSDRVALRVEIGDFQFGDEMRITLTNDSSSEIGFFCDGLLRQEKEDGKWSNLNRLIDPLLDCASAGPIPLAAGDSVTFHRRALRVGTYRIGANILVGDNRTLVLSAPFSIVE